MGLQNFDPIGLIERGYAARKNTDAWIEEMTTPLVAILGTKGELGCAFRLGPHGPNWIALPKGSYLTKKFVRGLVHESLSKYPAAVKPIVNAAFQRPGLVSSDEETGQAPDCWFLRAGGFVDCLVIVVPAMSNSSPVVFMSLQKEKQRVERGARAMWRLLASHLSAGLRLSGRPNSVEADDVECVMTPDGRAVDARGEATPADAREHLRQAAVDIDVARTARGRAHPERALQMWRGLYQGRWSLVDIFDTDGRRFILARRNNPDDARFKALPLRQRQVLFYAGAGWSNQEIGYAIGINESTVGVHLARALRAVGAPSREEWIKLSLQLVNDGRWACP